MFRQNVGTLDRDIRLVLAAIFGMLALFTPFGPWQIVAAVLAVVMLVTAATAICPLYMVFGKNTCDADTKQAATKQ